MPEVGYDYDGQGHDVLEDHDDDAVHLEHGQQQGLRLQGVLGIQDDLGLQAAPPHAAKWLQASVIAVQNLNANQDLMGCLAAIIDQMTDHLKSVRCSHGKGQEAASQPDTEDDQPVTTV